MASTSAVLVETTQEGVSWVTLNRPHAMNAINPEVLDGLDALLLDADSGRLPRVIVFTGSGAAFCAGVDLRHALAEAKEGWSQVSALLHRVSATLERIAALPIPVIAAVNGLALAGGLELVLCCDIVLASESAGFGDAHSNYGLLPGGGSSVRLPRRIGASRAKEMLFTGETRSAADMLSAGLVNRIFDSAVLRDNAHNLATRIARKSMSGLSHMKRLVDDGLEQPLPVALRMEHVASQAHSSSPDFLEGLQAFSEKRLPKFS